MKNTQIDNFLTILFGYFDMQILYNFRVFFAKIKGFPIKKEDPSKGILSKNIFFVLNFIQNLYHFLVCYFAAITSAMP